MGLRFEGDLSVWTGLFLALFGATGIFWVYQRETRSRKDRLAILLPVFRSLAVAVILLMLTGPVLRGKTSIADLSQVFVFVDASESMALTDTTMRPQRKVLSGQKMGWMAASASVSELYDASQALGDVDQRKLKEQGTGRLQFRQIAQDYSRQIQQAIDCLNTKAILRSEITSSLLGSVEDFEKDLGDKSLSDEELRTQLLGMVESVSRWRRRLENEFANGVESIQSQELQSRFDELSRWNRAKSALIDSPDAILPELRKDHHVELLALSTQDVVDEQATVIWQPLGENDLPKSLAPAEPKGTSTDLSSQVSGRLKQLPNSQQLAVVLVTDGQHNLTTGTSTTPLQLAKLLGRQGIPIFPIGVGAIDPPQDLAILGVQTPESVFVDDRVKGEVLVKDDMEPGLPMQITIEIDGERMWSDTITTDSSGTRTVEFDFPIKGLVEDRRGGFSGGKFGDASTDAISVPLPLDIAIDPVDGELRDDNNKHTAHVRAITRPRRALLIDGRPRWEFRYLRNMLQRDEHWEIHHVLTRHDGQPQALPRGNRVTDFPSDRDALFAYDLIVIGEVAAELFRDEELQWIKQFVASRGGGLMFIDGQRGKLRSFSQSAIGSLLPIRWDASRAWGLRDARLSLTDRGRATSALAFEGDTEDTAVRWTQLPALRWVAPAEALPGSEVLLEAKSLGSEANDGVGTRPALVLRRYGAGKVLYSAFDDSWRWRYETADRYHQKYWNQLATFAMESPYAIHDQFASLDTGGFLYQAGEAAEFKVRLRDSSGNPDFDARASVVLYRDEEMVATIPLDGGADSGGVLRGNSQPLEPGAYSVGLRADGYNDQQLKLRAEFVVAGEGIGELGVLYCNEELLKQMAALSGGQYLREEEAGRLPALLSPYSDGKDMITEIALWRSWYLFVPLVGLFSAEWFVRKRLGMI